MSLTGAINSVLNGKLSKLKIQKASGSDGKYTASTSEADTFSATINPESFSHGFSVNYSQDTGLTKSAPKTQFNSTGSETLDFTLILDGTGVVPGSSSTTVSSQMEKLVKVTYAYEGTEHETPLVKVSWGKGLECFWGRMTSMKTDYTLFHRDGSVLRAKVSLSFIQAMTAKREALLAKRSSPDLTHTRHVGASDTLPLLCHEIYQDASVYLRVAAFNKLTDFRTLRPGSTLRFPPLDQLESVHGR